ncbi:hypothetical protein BS78_02G298300 [Paspalum vaginatum]|nr:hypothetical protein BS78_02G298300 [Paspalum vaginatum]
MPISFSGRGCPVRSQKSSRSLSEQHGLMEQSPTARRELQLLEDHRPWEMLDNTVLAIIDQTYTALLRMHGRAPPPPAEDAGVRVVASEPADASDPDSPLLCVEASARHCCVHVPRHSRAGGGGGESFPGHAAATCSLFPTFPNPPKGSSWPPRHRLTRTRIHATLGTLYMARVDGGGSADYWSCADDDVRPDVVGTGLRGVVDAIRSRLDAAVRVEARLVEMVRAHRCRGAKAVGIFRVWTALGQMRREVSLDVIVRRARFQKRRRVELVTARPPAAAAERGAEEGDAEAEALAKSFNALQVDEDEAEVLTKRLKAVHI